MRPFEKFLTPRGILILFLNEFFFFLWQLPLEGWHSMATSAQPVLRLTQGEEGGGDVAFFSFFLQII